MEDMKKEIVLEEKSVQKILEELGHGEDGEDGEDDKGAIKIVIAGRGSQEDLKKFIDEKMSPMSVIPQAYTMGHADGAVYGYKQVFGLVKHFVSSESVQKGLGKEGIEALISLLLVAKDMGKDMKKGRKEVKKHLKKDCPWVLELIRQFKEISSEAEDEVEADAEVEEAEAVEEENQEENNNE